MCFCRIGCGRRVKLTVGAVGGVLLCRRMGGARTRRRPAAAAVAATASRSSKRPRSAAECTSAATAGGSGSGSSSGSSSEEEEYKPDTQDGAFFAALREFGSKIGVPGGAEPQQDDEPDSGRRSRRNRKKPDAWWEASHRSTRLPARLSTADGSPLRPATPPGAPPAKRKSVRRSLATGRMSQSPAPMLTQEQRCSSETASLMSKLEQSASELGLTLRAATLADVNNITQAHTRFEMEMAAWSPDAEPHLADAEGIRGIIEDEGGERIMLLTREISRSSCDLLGFVYSFDEEVHQSTYTGVSAYIAQVWLASSERGQGLGELLLCAAMTSALSRGTQASHLFLCEQNTGARRLYEKSGYAVDGDSGDPVHNLVLVNPALVPETIGDMLGARQARQQKLSRTGSRTRVARRAPSKDVIACPSSDPSTRSTTVTRVTDDSRTAKVTAARSALVEKPVNTAENVSASLDCKNNVADNEETTNAVCERCMLPFFTASGRSECVDCRTAPQCDTNKKSGDDLVDSSPAVSPDVSTAMGPAAQPEHSSWENTQQTHAVSAIDDPAPAAVIA